MTLSKTIQSPLAKSRPLLSVLDFDRSALLSRITDILKRKNVAMAYLVGSYARQEATLWSDIDLIIVCDSTTPFIERPRVFAELLDIGIPFDILVYTPQEFASLEQDPTSFWKTTQAERLRIV